MRKFIRIVSIISSLRRCTQIIFLSLSFLMLMLVSCGNDDEKMITLKPNMSIDLYEYQNGLYQFIPETDSLIVYEQIYNNGHHKKIIWLTEYGEKKKVLDVLD